MKTSAKLTIRTAAIAALCAACGPNVKGSAGAAADAGGDQSDEGTADAGAPPQVVPDAAPPALEASVYAHSSTSLFRIDPDTFDVTLVGDFQWPGAGDTMTDIAIDKDGRMTGISYSRVYSVDKDTGECQYLADLATSFNGLSWVPTDPFQAGSPEILVGASLGGEVYEVNPNTGQATLIGNYGNGWGSSGDIVSIRGFGTVATVTAGASSTDRLATIDPNTWEATIIGDTGELDIWGLGFWEDQVYGFTDNQKFVLIDIDSGAATEIEASSVNWWGAGVTTSAPVVD